MRGVKAKHRGETENRLWADSPNSKDFRKGGSMWGGRGGGRGGGGREVYKKGEGPDMPNKMKLRCSIWRRLP